MEFGILKQRRTPTFFDGESHPIFSVVAGYSMCISALFDDIDTFLDSQGHCHIIRTLEKKCNMRNSGTEYIFILIENSVQNISASALYKNTESSFQLKRVTHAI